jgi:prepilin-type processing-associated H-X9-DG protein
MEQKNGLSLVGLIVTIVIVLFVLTTITTFIRKEKSNLNRIGCEINLKGLGNAMMVYANDYDGNYPQLPGAGPWSKELGFAYDLEKPNFLETGQQGHIGRTITASWYLLVREADESPRSFVCPATNQIEFNGMNPANRNIPDLWDFGTNPYQHVSYAMHNPYGKYPAKDSHPASFAVASDMNPWMFNGDFIQAGKEDAPPQIISLSNNPLWKLGNSINHRLKKSPTAEGQNVLYADGHSAYETQPNVGMGNDNIYTYWSNDNEPSEQDIQGGTAPTGRTADNDAKSEEDSFLAI